MPLLLPVPIRRRHLDKGQKIALALEIEPFFAEEAKKRQGMRTDIMGKSPIKSEPARDQAAAAVGVSGKLVSAAKAVSQWPFFYKGTLVTIHD